MTEISNQYRREQIAKLLASYKESGERKSLPIEYRGETKVLEIIRIDPKVLLLNPNNSRLAAQLHDHHQKKVVQDHPTSEEAQEVLASLLRNTERFVKLKEELKEFKQQNPGLISRDGLLINGNTRVVALRDIGAEGVDVAVLPEDAEGYPNFMRQVVPRWTTTDAATIAAYTKLVEKVCPCVVLVHSQGGQFGQKVAQARPDLVKALILVEPAGFGDPNKAEAMKNIPILTIYGDYIDRDSRWPSIRKTQMDLNQKYINAGASVDVINLPEIGIKGNSHMMMMDKNNLQIAELIEDWLKKKGVSR
jgi:hypothetical protein